MTGGRSCSPPTCRCPLWPPATSCRRSAASGPLGQHESAGWVDGFLCDGGGGGGEGGGGGMRNGMIRIHQLFHESRKITVKRDVGRKEGTLFFCFNPGTVCILGLSAKTLGPHNRLHWANPGPTPCSKMFKQSLHFFGACCLNVRTLTFAN